MRAKYQARHCAPAPANTGRRVAAAAAVPVTALGFGVAGAGTASAAVVSTDLTLSPASRTVSYDTTVTLHSVLSTQLGPIIHRDVALYERANGGEWHRTATATTDRDGAVSFREAHLTRSEEWQVRFTGDAALEAADSPVRTITVQPPTSAQLGKLAVEEASRHAGAPYEWGADGPDSFDCSGLTKYVFAKLGHSLPHNSSAQYDAVEHVSRSDMEPGDLVFFHDSDGIYHVGIYAGHGQMWNAPHSGATVRKERLFNDSYYVGRVD